MMRHLVRARGAPALTGVAMLAISALPAAGQDNGQPTAQADVDKRDGENDDIIVRGIRASIQASIDAKRNADSVIDVIAAEDIGKFANENIAEAIQRVPGVQIDREGGEGRFVSIRGLGPQFNRTTINGRTAVSIGSNGTSNNRAFNFDSMATEFISRLTIYKTPTADLDEGGLGGIVDIRTSKPLDRRIGRGGKARGGSVTAIGLEGTYGDLVDKVDPRISVLASRTITDNLGVLVSGSWNRRSLREDVAEIPSQAAVTVTGQRVYRPTNIRQSVNNEQRDRVGANLAIQWQPGAWRFSLDYLYSLFQQDSDRDMLQFQTAANTVVAASQVIDAASQRVDKFNANNIQAGTFNQLNFNRTDTHIVGFNAARDFGPLTISADLSYATVLYSARLDSYLANFRTSVAVDLTGELPSVTSSTPVDPVQASQFIGYLAQVNLTRTKETEKAGQLDFKYDLGDGALSALWFGGKYRERSTDVRFNVYQAQNAALLSNANAVGVSLIPDREAFPVDNFLDGYETPIRSWQNIDTRGMFTRLAPVFDRIFPGGFDINTPDTSRSFGVGEEVLSGYGRLDLDGTIGAIRYRGNIGVRVAHTRSDARGFRFDPGTGAYVPTADKSSYTDWLPSANLALELSNSVVLRFGAARVITRPDLVDLSPTVIVQNLANGVARSGDPNLDPFRADQYDAILEWYPFNGRGSVAIGAFYKDIASFTETVVTREAIPGFTSAEPDGLFDITRPTNNGGGATVKGVEFAAQIPFGEIVGALDGFGVNANLTLIDSETDDVDAITGAQLGVTGVAKTNYNIVGYFEKWGFSTRVSYTYRDKFLLIRNSATTGGAEFTEPYGQLDANIGYDITPDLTISLQAVNITGEDTRRYAGRPELFRYLVQTDRRLVAGIRARF